MNILHCARVAAAALASGKADKLSAGAGRTDGKSAEGAMVHWKGLTLLSLL
jgi:hypothetical protein